MAAVTEESVGFFGKTGKVGGNGEYEVAEEGVYKCRLGEVTVVQTTAYKEKDTDPDVMVDQYKWVFETISERDSKGFPFKFIKYTGTNFGNDRANLTKLLDQMFGRRLTIDEFNRLDIPHLKRITWKVNVDESVSKTGRSRNNILSVKQDKAAGGQRTVTPAPAPVVDTDSWSDPFDQDEDKDGTGDKAGF